ncbi:MAG: stalk domain-containing protein [Peptoniphilus sp.]|nr:stalk domain-containing protein [Peptoniphilus sp.]MDY3118937.1 stalk domain-containing protein [Peptoniphilus sp.]
MNVFKRQYLFLWVFALVLLLPQDAKAVSLKENGRTTVSPGVVRRELSAKIGGRNHIVDVIQVDLNNPAADLEVMAGAGSYTRKDTVSHMADRTDAYAGINGDFFNMSKQGAPFGPSVVGGKLASSPLESVGLFAFGIDQNKNAYIESFTFRGNATAQDGAHYRISGLNKTDYIINHTQIPSHKDSIQLYNDFWTSPSRGLKGSGEVLVNKGFVVERISLDKPLPMATPKGKYILQVNGRAKDFIRNHVKVGQKLRLDYNVSPNRNWRFLIGGHALLVNGGRPQPYVMDASAIDGYRARSAAAISKDRKTVYLLATEGRTEKSRGMKLAEWAATVASLGVDRAINLDGGGSTTLVARGHGDFKNTQIARPEGNGAERRIPNGIGVMNRAPRTALAGGEISGPRHTVLGEVATYALNKAWDSNYHPIQASSVGYSLTDRTFGKNAWVYSRFLSPQQGKTDILLTTANGVTVSLPVDIQSPAALKSFTLTAKDDKKTIILAPKGLTKSGRSISIDPNQIRWSVENGVAKADTDSWKVPGENGLNDPAAVFRQEKASGAYVAYKASFGGHTASYVKEAPGYAKVRMVVGKKNFTAAGQTRTMDTTPVIKDNRTLVPLRFLMESYGAQVSWDADRRTATVNYQNHTIVLFADQAQAVIDGTPVALDVGATIQNNRTMVPLRFVVEKMGLEVYYEGSDRSISIFQKIE